MSTSFRRRKYCRFTAEKIPTEDVVYHNLDLLQGFVTDAGKIVPSRITGTSAKYQRCLQEAIKNARFLALLPYSDQH